MRETLFQDRRIAWMAGILIFIIYCFGLFIPLMDYDSGHHACIALHMYLTGDYTSLIDNGEPYLDKPHLLFWLTSTCYKIFGVTDFAYRLPSFLFSLLAIYSTYRLGKILYDKSTGILVAFILSTAFAFAVSIYDVRMEGLLTGSVIFSTWQLVAYTKTKKIISLLFASAGLAAGFSTKGMIGLAIPVMALLLQIIYTRQWKQIINPAWLLVIFLFALFITPVVYSYYVQFNLHPETSVKGQDNISGTGFILWGQSFKRMSGASHGANQSDYFFFFHTFLWAFLPWSIAAIYAMVPRISQFVKEKFKSTASYPEAVSGGAVIFFIVLFSFSKFKLPHYLNCLFPFFSIVLANYLMTTSGNEKKQKLHSVTQRIVSCIVIAFGLLLSAWAFPVFKSWKGVPLLLLFILWISVFFTKQSRLQKTIALTITGFTFLLACLFLNFYPNLLKYQAGNQLAFLANEEKLPVQKVFYIKDDIHSPTFDFYSAWLHTSLTIQQISDSARSSRHLWIYTSQAGLDSLKANGVQTGKIYSNPDFRVSVLTLPFINPATRSKAVTQTYLVEL
ncbi:MAG: glycosyltransferase family 39 protein [Chitinophagaceae bacterium]